MRWGRAMHKEDKTMKTQLLKVSEESIALGGRLIREGELVGFPTETVYGLGANALDADAVTRIFEAKGRPQDNPLITHVSCVEEIPALCTRHSGRGTQTDGCVLARTHDAHPAQGRLHSLCRQRGAGYRGNPPAVRCECAGAHCRGGK